MLSSSLGDRGEEKIHVIPPLVSGRPLDMLSED